MKGARIQYSAEEMAWLQANYKMVISDYQRAFASAFGRDDVSILNLNQLRKRKGWKVGRDGGRYVGRLRMFNGAEITWLRDNSALPIADFWTGFQQAFNRPDVTRQKLKAFRKRQGWKTGRTGRFEQGATPANKGKPCPPGKGGRHPNAQATQFRKGERRGVAVELYKPIGTERLSKEGYLVRKIHDGLPPRSRWRAVHLINWEAVNGPVPAGYCLKFLDGDRRNTAVSNLEAVPRALLPRLNGRGGMGYDHAEPEIRPSIMAVARLKHALSEKRPRRQPSTTERKALKNHDQA